MSLRGIFKRELNGFYADAHRAFLKHYFSISVDGAASTLTPCRLVTDRKDATLVCFRKMLGNGYG
jgi:hypothetical protein